MKFYLAGASVQAALIATWIANLEDRGHTCAHNWTAPVLAEMAAGKSDKDLGEADRQMYAAKDLAGVASADVFWLVMPPKGSSWGSGVELGYALARADAWRGTMLGGHKPWIVVSGDYPQSIFTCRADRLFAEHVEAFAAICKEYPIR